MPSAVFLLNTEYFSDVSVVSDGELSNLIIAILTRRDKFTAAILSIGWRFVICPAGSAILHGLTVQVGRKPQKEGGICGGSKLIL